MPIACIFGALIVRAAGLGLAFVLAGCASGPLLSAGPSLFHDELFAPPSVHIDPDDGMAISPAMRAYLAERMPHRSGSEDRRRQLVDVLYRKSELMLEYDSTFTRTAAQAFEARSGNCLALVMMTAAFAKELGLAVRFQAIAGDEVWDRADDLFLSIGHVNLTLDTPPPSGIGAWLPDPWTVDFMPSPQAGGRQRTRVIEERTVVAMYSNNRAVESLTRGAIADAYWWAREAIAKDPELSSGYLTLGVVYRAAHRPELADAALLRLLERRPDDKLALANRIGVLRDLGRPNEAEAIALQLTRIEPHPPFSYFREGMAALRERRLETARELFAKEVERAPYHHEFEFWLAVACAELHDDRAAQTHLARAIAVSTTRKDHDLYAAKLARLKALNMP